MNPGEGKGTDIRFKVRVPGLVISPSSQLDSLPPAFTPCQGEAAVRDLWRNAVPSKAPLMVP